MRTRNEKILLAVLIAIVFISANMYGYKWLTQTQARLELTYAQLRADKAEAEVDLLKQEQAARQQAWVNQHEPALGEEGEAKAQVLEAMQKGARDNHLEILEQSLDDVQRGPSGTRISAHVKLKGPMEGIVHWMADLQRPTDFYAIPQISLKVDPDQKSMICELQLARFFKGGS